MGEVMMSRVELAREQSVRFWSKVDMSGSCWLWLRGVDKGGYGKFQLTTGGTPKQLHVRAHRVAYELTYGELPPDAVLLHSCDTPRCVKGDV